MKLNLFKKRPTHLTLTRLKQDRASNIIFFGIFLALELVGVLFLIDDIHTGKTQLSLLIIGSYLVVIAVIGLWIIRICDLTKQINTHSENLDNANTFDDHE